MAARPISPHFISSSPISRRFHALGAIHTDRLINKGGALVMVSFGLLQAHGRGLTLSFAFIVLFLVSHSYAYGLERSSEKDGQIAELDSRIRSAAMLLMDQHVMEPDFQQNVSSVLCQLYLPLRPMPDGSCPLPLMLCSQAGLASTLIRF